jgi:hypothetical protein
MLETQEQFSVNVLLNRVNANARTALAGDRTGVAFDPSNHFRWTPFWLETAPAFPAFPPSMVVTTG